MRRRQVLAAGLATALSAATRQGRTTEAAQQLMNIGFQLYTARDYMAESVEATLDQLATLGYDEVEFAGYFGRSPAQIRAALAESGLVSPSAHVSLAQMRDAPEVAIETARQIGHQYLVLAWLDPEERERLDQYRALADLCNRFAEQCQLAGLEFAYHNHAFEYERLEGKLPMDLLLTETPANLVKMEMDVYWVNYAGVDPFAYFEQHPGRFPLCHAKDMDLQREITDVGSGIIDFAELFGARELAGMKHVYVERDNPIDAMTTAASSLAYLRQLRFRGF